MRDCDDNVFGGMLRVCLPLPNKGLIFVFDGSFKSLLANTLMEACLLVDILLADGCFCMVFVCLFVAILLADFCLCKTDAFVFSISIRWASVNVSTRDINIHGDVTYENWKEIAMRQYSTRIVSIFYYECDVYMRSGYSQGISPP